ncbi:hypothetical protein [Streptomyces subrutilus]|uniref:hypothetical protein n=1 Tax=Streptomyces subrutilus TaxID=36818 RepID=UPI002E11257C|nr:hypothetical protein OG479_01795 [Streptomyces subrutilus]
MLWNRRRDEGTPPGGPNEERAAGGTGFLVEEYDRVLLLRQPSDELLGPQEIADLVRCAESDDPGTVTVVAGADEESSAALWPRLGTLLDWVRDEGATAVRLVMSGSGDGRPGARPAVAQRIADAWELEVVAPDGTVLCVPGGGLFVHGPPGGEAAGERGWWRFRPGAAPVPLGLRQPVPAWQPGRLPSRTRGGCVVEEIPAGVLIRSDGGSAPQPGDLYHAVPMDDRGPLLVLGVPDGEEVGAEDVSDVVAALPDTARSALRVAPGGRRDALGAGRAVAELVGAGVVVHSGLPLLTGSDPDSEGTVRSVVVGRDGAPRWQPFVDSVLCAPGVTEPTLLEWSPPLPRREAAGHGVVHLSDRWQVAVSRAGLLVGARDGAVRPLADLPVDADGPAIEVGIPGEELDPSLWPALSELLDGLEPDVCTRARLHVHGKASDGGRELRRLAALHGLRSVRFASFGRQAQGAARAQGAPRSAGTPRTETAAAPSPAVASPAAAAVAAPAGAPAPDAGARAPAGPAVNGSAGGTAPGPAAGTPVVPAVPVVTGSGPGTVLGAVPGGGTETAPVPAAGAPVAAGGPRRGDGVASRPATEPVPALRSVPLPATGSDPLAGPGTAGGADPGRAGAPNAPRPVVTTAAAPLPDPAAAARTAGAPAPAARPTAGAAGGGAVASGGAPAAAGPGRVRAGGAPGHGAPRTDPSAGPPATPVAPPVPPAPDRAPDPVPDPAPATRPAIGLESAPSPVPAVPPHPRPAAAPAAPAPSSALSRGPLPPVPVLPEHHSTEAERTAFRTLTDTAWERHAAAVARTLTRLPALRGAEQAAARADLVALLLYLGPPDEPFGHRELDRALRAGGGRLLPYAACAASALRRMPSFRGLALRGSAPGREVEPPWPGTVLRDPAAVSALPYGAAGPEPGNARFAIWSVTGRRVRQLFGAAGSSAAHDEVVFAPGTAFRVLDVRSDGPEPLVLLRQLSVAASAAPPARYAEPDAEDRAVLARLDEALGARPAAPTAGFAWPERCAGPLGEA